MALNKWAVSDAAGTEAAGRFNWAMAVTAPLFMFANLRFRSILATDTRSDNQVRDFFILRATLLAVVGAIAGLVAFQLLQAGEPTKAWLVLAIAGAKAVEAISDLCCGIQQRVERMDRIAVSLTANGVAMVGVFAATYIATDNIVWATLGLLTARILVLTTYDIPMAKVAAQAPCFIAPPCTTTTGRDSRLRTLLLTAVPLGITAALLSLTSNIPRYIIPQVFDYGMLGIYASLAVTLQAGNLIFSAVELPALPRLAKHLAAGDARAFWGLLRKLVGLFVALGTVGCIVSLLYGGRLLNLLFNSEYAMMGGVLALFVVGNAIAQIAGIIESSLIAARLTAVQLPMHCITVVLCLVLSLAFIPSLAIYGAVLAVTICRFPFMGIGLWLLRQKLVETQRDHTAGVDSEPFPYQAA